MPVTAPKSRSWFAAHAESTREQIQQAAATKVSPNASVSLEFVWIASHATSQTTANIGTATQASACPVSSGL